MAITAEMPALWERLRSTDNPVERDLAEMLAEPPSGGLRGHRLERYQRKVDVARSLKVAYDDEIRAPLSDEEISCDAYLALGLVFAKIASCEPCDSELSRARVLRWVNSAFNCLDHLPADRRASDGAVLEGRLLPLLRRGTTT